MLNELRLKLSVSIPKRVSEALKLGEFLSGATERARVSIPKRVSEALKPIHY